jgi:hypothetical protein
MIGSDCDRAAVLRDAGSPGKLDGQPVDCIFRDGHVPQDINDTRLAFRSITATVLTSACSAVNRGASLFEHAGKRYTVQDVEDDGTGLSMLVLTAAQYG